MTPDEQPPEGFDLDAEQSREADAAKSGITAREADPIDEVGDPAEPDPGEPGDVHDDDEIDDPDDTATPDDI
jgi:hypothetical protein